MDDYVRAPLWRRWTAGAIDAAAVGAIAWLGARGAGGPAEKVARMRFLRMVPADALREQVRTPGQRLLGVRTVDRRTGARVALWRTALLTGLALGGNQLTRRLGAPQPTPEQQAENARFLDEVRDIHQRHPAGGPAREAEMQELRNRQPPAFSVQIGRTMAPVLAASLLTARLRRRLAPTVDVLARGRE